MTDHLWNGFSILLLILGFGFVVFFHELGHFLAAKWVGIKVEQFALGFGPAIMSWRKGMGFTLGSSGKKLSQLEAEHQDISRFGETEYRWNWVPLGGYVKMLGQDDMNPNAQSDDPRSFNRKSIGARMLVVSAGVIMNVILAAILFMGVFLIGFKVAPAVVGSVQPGSPAQKAGLAVGDRIIELNGSEMHDYNKLQLSTALVHPGQAIPMLVEHPNRQRETLYIRPEKPGDESGGFLMIGIGRTFDLMGEDSKQVKQVVTADGSDLDSSKQVLPGDVVVAINGEAVNPTTDYWKLDRALQQSYGKPVDLTVRNAAGQERTVKVQPSFLPFFGSTPFNVAGLEPLPQVNYVLPDSVAKGQLQPGDIIEKVKVNDLKAYPTYREFLDLIYKAGDEGQPVDLTILRDGQTKTITGLVPTVRVGAGHKGLGIAPNFADDYPVVAGAMEGSAAAKAGIPRGAKITAINGQPVKNWFDIHRLLSQSQGASAVISAQLPSEAGGEVKDFTMSLDASDRQQLASIRYGDDLMLLKEHIQVRKTSNPFVAAGWGVTETRDLLLQFYVTLRRLTQGSVPASNLMGPVGIVYAGSKFAFHGFDWLVWFLAMISANLAVVNFLPIPIVDGGLFTFLIVEKIQGKPLSPRMQTVAQMVGLAIILSVFLFVTYNDIARFF